MIADLLDTAKFIGLAGGVLGLLYLAYRFGGIKGLAGALVATAALFVYRKGRDEGRQAEVQKGREDAQVAINEAQAARRDAARRDADPERLRDDDGFRRD